MRRLRDGVDGRAGQTRRVARTGRQAGSYALIAKTAAHHLTHTGDETLVEVNHGGVMKLVLVGSEPLANAYGLEWNLTVVSNVVYTSCVEFNHWFGWS